MAEPLRIKFCGFTRPQDVEEALRLRVDYLGFVFVAGNPRFLDVQAASEWLPGLDTGPARRVGIFRDEPARQVNEIARRLRLDVIQLQGHEPRDYPRALDLPVFVVRRVFDRVLVPAPRRAETEESLAPNVCAVVVDARDEAGSPGGLGMPSSDKALRILLTGLPRHTPFFLSGGLTPENVAKRVADFRPSGIDVSSSIECAPGHKDPGRMRDFMRALGRTP